MSVNKHQPHLLVLPEDDANRQIVNAFAQTLKNARSMQVLPIAGGWRKVQEAFAANEVAGMRKYPQRLMLLLVDWDKDANRANEVRACIPKDLHNRVFVLGVWSEPERLKRHVKGGYEGIGQQLAQDCAEDTRIMWEHPLLAHNRTELEKMLPVLKPLLFAGM